MRIKRMGWRPDLPDVRDYGVNHPDLPPGFARDFLAPLAGVAADVEVDMRHHVARLLDQGNLGSCTGHGGIGLHEFLDKKTYGRFTPLSRLFLYKATRNFIGVTGDTGAEIRNMMGALAMLGAPPEEFYPYDEARFDEEPTAFHYQLAANYKGAQYARLDCSGMTGDAVLEQMKAALLRGWPFVFGFTCYESFDDAADGDIPFPGPRERVTGGHCMYATGFADGYDRCRNAPPGAFSGPNSWGKSWGDAGCYRMPYEYVRRGLLQDAWVLIRAGWVDPEPFK